jgi:hypothetical protein
LWRDSFGQAVAPFSASDGNGNGVIDSADYTVWRDNFGMMLEEGAGSVGVVPEPNTACYAMAVLSSLALMRAAR